GGLGVGVARRVNKDTAAPRALSNVHGVVLRIGGDKTLRDCTRKGADVVEIDAPVERHQHMQTSGSCGLHKSAQAVVLKKLPQFESGSADGTEIIAGGIQVEDHVVGALRLV